jgi:hypothetical protein
VGEKIDTIQQNTNALLHASKEAGLEENPEKTKYMSMPRCQNADVAKFKYLGTLTDNNCMHRD